MTRIEIELRTFFLHDEKHIPFDEFTGPLKSNSYVEGFIDLKIGETILLSARWNDLVDQLWSYLITGLETIKNGESFECYFPDTAAKISMIILSDETIEFAVHDASAKVNRSELILVMANEALRFSRKMAQLDESAASYWLEIAEFVQSDLLMDDGT